MEKVILYATPVFFGLMALEFVFGLAVKRNTFRINDSINSISLGVLSQVSGAFTRFWRIAIYTFIFEAVALWRLPETSVWVWIVALLAYDFCYYWHHRAAHQVNMFWGAHVVHHSSEAYNLSTALRQSSSNFWFTWIFYVPMAVAGVPPKVFAAVAIIDLLYQYWVHTEHIKTLGWFDRVFVSPMNHRVHHAVNEVYVDKNFGGILVVWDRLFGTFQPELPAEPCVYGTRSPLRSWNPIWANVQVYAHLFRDAWHAKSWSDKLKVFWSKPGWRPADVASRDPKPAFAIAQRDVFNPPVRFGLALYCLAQFSISLWLATQFLAVHQTLSFPAKLGFFGLLVAMMWTVGGLLEGRKSFVWLEAVRALAVGFGCLFIGVWFTGAPIRPPLGLPIMALTLVSVVFLVAVSFAPQRSPASVAPIFPR
jgi:alkylglycerol monooxygenase